MRLRTRCALACLTTGCLAALELFTAGDALAQDTLAATDTGADTHLFRPPVDSKGFFHTNGADIVGHLDFSLGLFLDYGYGIMPVTEGKHGEGSYLLDHSFQGTLQFDLGLLNLFIIGISAPVVLAGHGQLLDIGPTGNLYSLDEDFAQGLEYVALHTKFRIVRPEETPSVGLAAILQGGIGVAGSDNLIAEPGGFIWPQVAFEGRAGKTGWFRIGVNGGFRAALGGTHATFGEDADGDPVLDAGVFEYGQLVTSSVGMSFRVVEPLDVVIDNYQSFLVTGNNATGQRISAESIAGLKIFIDGKSFLYLGGGPGYAPGFQTARARATVGFVFEPSIGDRDGDGFKDDEDDCPDNPEDRDGFEDTRADAPPGQLGCPDPDNDKDGILDVDDDCPNNPEDKDGDEDQDGCPESRDGDRDGDGILDSRDKCPDEPEDKDGFEDRDGCPDPDNDKDGIPDVKDDCPNDPEDKDGDSDEDGCPEPDKKGPVIIKENEILILEKVQFATGSAAILPASEGILDAVANVLKEHPEFTLVEIQGHADERADDNYNLRLTKDRAKSVMTALTKRGIAANRLRSQGFGEYCPLDPASNAEAWEKNRRVEFKIVRKDGQPTDIELGCAKATEKGVKSAPP
jgi:outer membrane protein OmpA-like peptidoglycan-associated protein